MLSVGAMSGLSAPILIKSFLFQGPLTICYGGGRYCAVSAMGMILSLLLEFADVIKSHPRPLSGHRIQIGRGLFQRL